MLAIRTAGAVKPLRGRNSKSKPSLVTVTMVYNEYGELVDERTLRKSPKPEDLSVTQLLRVIKKAYHHDVSKALSLWVAYFRGQQD
jgi:hypothetical protein